MHDPSGGVRWRRRRRRRRPAEMAQQSQWVDVTGSGRRRPPRQPRSDRSPHLKWMLTSPPSPLAQSARASSHRQSLTWPDSDARSSGKLRMLGKTNPPSTTTFRSHTTFSLGQDPPPLQQEDAFDGRSLAEVCVTYIPQRFQPF